MADRTQPTITIPLETARLIDSMFLPLDPRRIRRRGPELARAAQDFRRLVTEADAQQRASENAP